jgi:uncharacterized protein
VFEVAMLVDGRARGPILLLDEPLSFWGGVDPEDGSVIDRRHPQAGSSLAGAIVVMPSGRGSSSSSNVLAEAIRLGTAPAGIVLKEADGIIVLGAIVARELYGNSLPVVVAGPHVYDSLPNGAMARIEGGRIELIT